MPLLVALLLLAAPLSAQDSVVTLLGYRTTVPRGWAPRAPSSQMRLAEFTVAAADGSSGAEVVVYFFGAGQGGNVEANLTTYARGIGAGSAAEQARPNHTLIAGIAETPRGTLFIQLFGPTPGVQVQKEALNRFVRGLATGAQRQP